MTSQSSPGRQLPLDLPHKAAMERADFLVGDANRTAIELIDRWPDWPSRVVLLAGPVGAGKTHLAEIWRAMSGARMVPARALGEMESSELLAAGALVVEDLHEGPVDERALFHLLNLAKEQGATVLVTSRVWASALPLTIPDLASRLRAAQPVELDEPNDDLLARVLTKLFADRQLNVDASVIAYIVTRMERSLEAANAIVAWLDREALAGRRAVTRRLAAEALAAGADGQSDEALDET